MDEGGDYEPLQTAELFAFDPNTVDSSQLRRLGFPQWQIRNVYKYRQAGGVFRRPEDFAKLYGMTVSQFKRLRPYIQIREDFRPATVLLESSPDTVKRRLYPEKMKAGETLDLNLADTAQLCHVPGIGPFFARRIVAYGQRLGGYVSISQLDEIEDFPVEAKSFLVVQHPSPRQLNVNRLSLQELKRHPYINYYQAKAIVDYRRQHGPLRSLNDLSLLKDFPAEAIQRLEPYVCY
jgi:DNA uptake protein ComE-like DNA-binding protein